MKVYKYGAKHVYTALCTQRIKVSEASELNDPFELSPRVDASRFTVARAMQFLRQSHNIDEWYSKEGQGLGFTNKKRYKAHYLTTLRDRAEGLMPMVPSNVEAAGANFARTFGEHWRLFCTSLRRDAILMWSHYSANHTGAVIEFETDAPPFSELGRDYCLTVQYSDQKPEFFYRPKSVGDFQHALSSVVQTKSVDWTYEQEVRFMFPVTALVERKFVPFPARAISSVVLGARMSAEERERYVALASEPRYAHTNVYSAALSHNAYALDFKLIKPASAEPASTGNASIMSTSTITSAVRRA